MSTETDRMRAIHDELNQILEERVTDLLAQMKALRVVTQEVAATEIDIRRQEILREQLEAELPPLQAENGELSRKVDVLKDTVGRMKRERDDMLAKLSGLTGDLKGLTGGS